MLSEELWREMVAQGTARRFPARSVLLRQGAPGTHLLALTEGLVKVVRHERCGGVTLLAFRGPGDLLGETSVFDGGTRIADVVSLSSCTAVVLDARRFRLFVEEHGVAMELVRQALDRLRESDLYRAELLTLPLIARLARTLIRLAALASPAEGATRTPLRLSGLTQEELAQSVGVTRNALGAGLRRLRGEGAVETARRAVVIRDMEALRLLAAAD
ncbi:Crp/Fnr family transcriptional regulator [Streptomyces carminius]|uniref:Crp/Fnr family transcriptional regulator n=1 Tax=Streptomyces carminius TaxID=2665496 RepID=UPI001E65BA03|nr:Crp/Fnr family transcriptional regulator [Streptomyces carminius]